MYTIQAGSFVLNGQLLLVLLFGITGWAAMRLYLRGHSDVERLGDIAVNAFLIWIMVWKGSLLLWEPAMTWAHPVSLLYYDGGEKGEWTASLATAGYAMWRTRKGKSRFPDAAEAASMYLIGGFACYHAALALLESEFGLYHAANTAFSIGMLLTFYSGKMPIGWDKLVERWFWLLLGWTSIWFMHPDRSVIFLSLNMQQMIGLGLGSALFIIARRLERRSET